jgi:hypothetical protein
MQVREDTPQHHSTPHPSAGHQAMPDYTAPSTSTSPAPLRLSRLIAIRLFEGSITLGAMLRPYIGFLAVIALLLGVIFYQALFLVAPTVIRAFSTDERVQALPQVAAVEEFLDGQKNYDADRIWQTLSPVLQESLSSQGASKESIQAQIDNERLAGQRYIEYKYIGGTPVANGRQMFFYVVDIESPSPERNGSFSFVFTVDQDGKIIGLDM